MGKIGVLSWFVVKQEENIKIKGNDASSGRIQRRYCEDLFTPVPS